MAKNNNDTVKILSVLNHLSGIFIGFLGPLIFLLASEEKEVKKQAKAALNWQLSLLIYGIISTILIFVLIGIPLLIILGALNIIFPIIAAIKASENHVWNYPLTIPFLKV